MHEDVETIFLFGKCLEFPQGVYFFDFEKFVSHNESVGADSKDGFGKCFLERPHIKIHDGPLTDKTDRSYFWRFCQCPYLSIVR
jgi:hypothetical protein